MRGFHVAAAFTVLAFAARADEAIDLLKKVEDTYNNLNSAHFEAVRASKTQVGKDIGASSETKMIVSVSKPNKVKVDYIYPGQGGEWLRVSDGKTFSGFRSITKENKQQPASENDMDILNGTFVDRFRHIAENVASAKILRDESVAVGSKQIPCRVVEVTYKNPVLPPNTEQLPTTYWIDKDRNIVLKETSGTRSTTSKSETIRTLTFTAADVNTPLADTEFAFNPKR